jgi:hypothetical protein
MEPAVQPEINCSICDQPVELETAKTDDNGQPVHSECYVLVVAVKPANPRNPQPSAS